VKARSANQYPLMYFASIVAILVLMITSLGLEEVQAADTLGSLLRIGTRIPELSGLDQFGKPQNLESLKGPNGLVLLFFRSADW
jgi:hypothetical protein